MIPHGYMNALEIISLLISLTALLAYANHRWLRLPTTIGVMLIALLLSLSLTALDALGVPCREAAHRILSSIPFDYALMNVMLSFLLFAGALHVNLEDLAKQKWIIGLLATLGVVISTALVGGVMYYVFKALGLSVPFLFCLLFGSLISPTDPIAVLGILKTAGAPKSLETKVVGESLFNDGVGVVVFLVLFEIAVQGHEPAPGHIAALFAEEAIGGALLGLGLGWIAYRLLRTADDYTVEILITLALVMGGYALATALHMSGPIAMVVAGLLIGNHGRSFAMSDRTREHLDTFWELVDEILNAVLFVFIGLEVLILTLKGSHIVAGLVAFPLLLACRFVAVAGPIQFLSKWRTFSSGAIRVMTWGGIRGGISVALALSIPATMTIGDTTVSTPRDLILTVTYVVVVLSILLQGLTIGTLLKRLGIANPTKTDEIAGKTS
jgi:CPA1 family monovalent cation:H+ antiporter